MCGQGRLVTGEGIVSSQVARQLQEPLLKSWRLGSVANWHRLRGL